MTVLFIRGPKQMSNFVSEVFWNMRLGDTWVFHNFRSSVSLIRSNEFLAVV
jgi:hypothetical protein